MRLNFQTGLMQNSTSCDDGHYKEVFMVQPSSVAMETVFTVLSSSTLQSSSLEDCNYYRTV